MINITDIPHLRAYQPISTIPKRNGESNRGVVVFLSSPSLDKSTTMLDGKHITNTSVRNYYVERNYHEKIGSRTEHLLLTMSDVPERFKTAPSTVVTRVNSLENLPTGSNRFIDLAIYNKLFFKVLNETSMTYTAICREYMSLLKRAIVQTQYNIFPEKLLLINLDDWEDYSAKEFGRPDSLNNPAAIIYYALYKYPDLIKELGNVNIVFYSQNSGYKVRINPSLVDGESARRFRNEVSRVSSTSSRLMSGDFDAQLREEEVRNGIVDTFGERYNLVGDTDDKTTSDIKKAVKKSVDEKDSKNPDSIEETKDTIAEEVDNDKELASKVSKIIQTNKVGKSATSSKRDAQLRKRQAELKIGNSTLGEILESKTANEIPVDNIGDKLSTTNANMYNVRFTNFEKAYNEQLMQKDIMSMVTSLNDTRLPVHVRSVKIEDKSDELNFIDRYYIQLEDENRVRHQLTFDMPKFIDDKFMYLHGNRKEIVKQQLMLPIVKARPNEVQIVSNYKKIFVRREGDKISPKLEKFKKFMAKSPEGFKMKEGNTTSSNRSHIRTIEFDELAKKYEYIDFGSGRITFNLNKVEEMCADKKAKFMIEKDDAVTDICIGFYKGKQITDEPIYLNVETQKVASDMDIVDFLLTFAKDEQVSELKTLSAGKRYMFTGATLMRKRVPIALLVAYHEGLSSLLRKVGVKYYFTDKRPKVGLNERVIQFEDGFLVYEEGTMDQTLIMNGFSVVPTRAYKFEEFDDKDVYLDIFDAMFKQRNIASAFDNFYDFMIDPITKEILDDMDLPTNYVDVLIYASNLLADNAYTEETDLSLYRIRSNEILNSYLYNAVATAYSTYIATANNPNPIKISIPRDTIVKSVLTAQTVEDYSILNPIVEVEKGRAVTAKGPSGANLDQSYTMAKRSYSPSMTGVMAMSSSPDANVGVVRAMSTEPSVTSARGYVTNNQGRLDELKDVNIFSPGELLSPMGASRDDTIRTSMAIKQSKHIIPVQKSSPVLISNGMEQALPFNTGNDFSIVAKEDGKVVEINEQTETIVVEYKKPLPDGSRHLAIDISKKVVKNGAGGFYLANQMVHSLKVGQTVKKNDILAYDKNFFTNDNDGVRFNIGSLEKIAVFSNAATMEDSAFVTHKLTNDIATKITMPKSVSLGKNANIDYMVKIGDKVKVGDELIRFESSFKDDSLNKFLDELRTDLNEEIKSLGKKPITTKYSGEVVDIKIYSTVDPEELSPSLQKVVKDYYSRINKRKNVLNKYDKTDSKYKMGIYQEEPTSKVDSPDGKVKGEIVGEGVLIQIFVEYTDIAGVGDKIAFFTALKGIIGDVVDPGLEPFTLNEPDEEISAFVAPGAVLARMTPSILLTLFGNKALVGLKKNLKAIYEK